MRCEDCKLINWATDDNGKLVNINALRAVLIDLLHYLATWNICWTYKEGCEGERREEMHKLIKRLGK